MGGIAFQVLTIARLTGIDLVVLEGCIKKSLDYYNNIKDNHALH